MGGARLVWGIGVGLVACAPSADLGASRFASHECALPTDPCEDDDPCTTDRCDVTRGECVHIALPGCCRDAEDCPLVGCTSAHCELGVCAYRGVPGCDAGALDAGEAGRADAGDASDDGGADDGAVEDAGGQGADGATIPHVRGGACAAAPPTGRGPRGLALAALVALVALVARSRRGLLVGVLVALALPGAPARAQPAFRLDRTPPALPGDLGALERAAPEAATVRPGARLALAYVDDPLVAVEGADTRALVAERFGVTGAASLAFLDRAFVAIGAGLVVQGGAGLAGVDAAGPPLDVVAPAPPTLDGRVVLLDRTEPIELAIAATVRLPAGSHAAFATDADASVWPRVLLARALDERGGFVGLSVGVDGRAEARLGDLEVGPMLTFAAGAAVTVGSHASLTLELEGATVLARAFDPSHTPVRASAGVRWAAEGLSVHAWAGGGVTPGFGAPDVLAGLAVGAWIPTEAP
ncbi:MAG: hypothetical protein KF729_34765 [Sandaracinaceae bacterium]|nr:hypothetical protein [Sandaracinaceae bacterium]